MKFTNWFEIRKKEVQKKSKIKTIKKVIYGTAAGSLSGLLGGLLFSPKSGKETREDILSTSKDITNNIKEKTTELKGDINNKVIDAKESVTDAKVKIYKYLRGKKSSEVIVQAKDGVSHADDLSSSVRQTDIVDKK